MLSETLWRWRKPNAALRWSLRCSEVDVLALSSRVTPSPLPSYLFDEDLGRDDWKLLLGALDDRPSQDVAAARGWMTYVIARCREVTRNRRSDDQPVEPHKLSPEDCRLMQDTFCRLDRAREQLAKLSGRDFSTFENGGVLATIHPPQTLAELGIAPNECRARRKEGYARIDP
jgi:hypothetical protein